MGSRIRMGRQPRSKGFTLLEAVVVVAVAAVVFALVGTGMVRTLRTSRDEVNRMSRVMTARLIMERVVRDIEAAFPYEAPQTGKVVFKGVDTQLEHGPADRLTLIRPKLGDPVLTQLERVTYLVRLQDTERGTQQVVVSSRHPVGRPTGVREVVLGLVETSSNVALDFQYQTTDARGTTWQNSWEETDRLPEAVKVRLEVTDSRAPGTVELENIVYIHSERVEAATP